MVNTSSSASLFSNVCLSADFFPRRIDCGASGICGVPSGGFRIVCATQTSPENKNAAINATTSIDGRCRWSNLFLVSGISGSRLKFDSRRRPVGELSQCVTLILSVVHATIDRNNQAFLSGVFATPRFDSTFCWLPVALPKSHSNGCEIWVQNFCVLKIKAVNVG